jgi:signal transduction histidine kinase
MVINETQLLTAVSKDLQWENRNFIRRDGGDRKSLTAYLNTRNKVDSLLASLTVLTMDNPRQQHNIALLRKQLEALKAFCDSSVARKQKQGFTPADFSANITQQVVFHQSVTAILDNIRDEENRLLALREARNNKTISAGSRILFIAGILILLLLILSVITLIRDFNLHKKAENESLMALKKERQLNQMKSNFVALASHEFRTPLSSILSSASLLEQYTTTEMQDRRDKHIQRIKSSVGYLVAILEEFLSLERIEEGKVRVQKECFNIKNQVTELIHKFMAGDRGHQLKYEHQGRETVFLDQAFIEHILTNLISNAIKYSPDHSDIFIFTMADDRMIKLVVKDQGIGISASDQKLLFEKFFRAANTGNIKGTGLGLHIVKRYVDLMEAEISVESDIGKGTSFIILIPAENARC